MEGTRKTFSQKSVLYFFLSISLVLHLCLSYTHIKDSFSFDFKTEPSEKKIVIKLQSSKSSKSKQVVQTEQSKLNEKNEKAKFFSNKNNTFARETRSANIGSFKSAAKGERNATAKKEQKIIPLAEKEKFKNIKFSDLGFKSSDKVKIKKQIRKPRVAKRKKGLLTGRAKGTGLGQTNDFLDDMPLGDFTKLNTQEYEYYGFYHRVRQKLEQFWGSNIQEKAERIFKAGRSLASDANLVTGLTISLNAEGEIVDILVKSTSGIKELDDAAIESFNQAGPFPNPPKGMVKGDRATIEWGFVVNT